MRTNKSATRKIGRRCFLKRSALLSAAAIGGALSVRLRPNRAAAQAAKKSRVVWAHDDQATNWSGSGYYGDFVDQDRVNRMIDEGLKTLTGRASRASAWGQIISDYAPGKIVAIKLNINNSPHPEMIDALAAPVNGVILGLKSIGVRESDIYVMEPSRPFPERIGEGILALYPDVVLWEWNGGRGEHYGRPVTYSRNPALRIVHSHPDLTDSYFPDQLGDASYFINMPILKGHGKAGISLAFKNNFGLMENVSAATGIQKFHPYMYVARSSFTVDQNPLVDITGHPVVRDKTVLVVGDGLFGHPESNRGAPFPWDTFGGGYPNSIFLSTDPVAIDSVMSDFLNAEHTQPEKSQLYLHRAMELGLGIHEHWNNAAEKIYTNIDFVATDLSINRKTLDRKIRDFRRGHITEQEVEQSIREYGG